MPEVNVAAHLFHHLPDRHIPADPFDGPSRTGVGFNANIPAPLASKRRIPQRLARIAVGTRFVAYSTRYSAYGRTAIRPPHAAIRDCGTRRNATDTLFRNTVVRTPVVSGYKNVVCRKHAPSSDRRYFPTVNHRPDSSGVTSSINFPSGRFGRHRFSRAARSLFSPSPEPAAQSAPVPKHRSGKPENPRPREQNHLIERFSPKTYCTPSSVIPRQSRPTKAIRRPSAPVRNATDIFPS